MAETARPSPPSNVKVNGLDKADNLATKVTDGTAPISAELNDPQGNDVRLLVQWGIDITDTGETRSLGEIGWGTVRHTEFVKSGKRAGLTMSGLKRNTRYRVRMWAEDKAGHRSQEKVAGAGSTSLTFWTNRPPSPPTVVAPKDGQTFDVDLPVFIDWQHVDPDGDKQQAYQIRYKEAKTTTWTNAAGVTITTPKDPRKTDHTFAAGTFKSGRYYDWQVRTMDPQRIWGDWSFSQDMYFFGEQMPPTLIAPIKDVAVDVLKDRVFAWKFDDRDKGDVQKKADIRYRAVGAVDWVTLPGDLTTPGADGAWTTPAGTFQPGAQYEWQVRTYDTLSGGTIPSDWSASATFRSIMTPGWKVADVPPISGTDYPLGSLGCGTHRAFVFARGGIDMIGEITPLTRVIWGRKRDDIANAIIDTNGFGDDCCRLLAGLRSWMHELVIYRDKDRVFEGPVTRITYTRDSVEVEAKDVMAYPYRRILKQGYNESYHLVKKNAADKGTQLGLGSVVNRALMILSNALAYDDPNVLPYLTAFVYPNDSGISRVVHDFTKTAWEEVDDLAATAGLDYTTVGRRIMLWDTHQSIGKLPEMSDNDFLDPPVVTEYGMQTANYFAVTNNNGIYGEAWPLALTNATKYDYYGPVEQIASSYGEVEAAAATTMTKAARDALTTKLSEQALRNIGDRWPTPLIVRVPDNSALNPEVNLGIQQLVPGVWIPLRSVGTCRPVSQWQKLDSVTVEEVSGTEQVRVVMSPAPNGGNDDPDAEQAVEE